MIKNTRVHIDKRVLLLIFLSSFFVSCESTQPLQDDFTLNGEYYLHWNNLPEISSDLKLGGFTGLFYKGGRTFYTVTSRGPLVSKIVDEKFETYYLLQNFIPKIVKLELQDDHTITVAEQINIKNPLGNNCSGRLSPTAWSEDEVVTNDEQITDEWGIYPSGIYYDINANLIYVSEQFSPSVLQVTPYGNWYMRVSAGEGFRQAYSNQTCNGGIAGIDITPEGDFLVALARSLEHNRNINDPDQTRSINYSLRRIGIYHPDTRTDLSMFYFVETTDNPDDIRFTELGDIEFVNDTTYLVTEISRIGGETHALLFETIVTDSSSRVQEGLEGIAGKSFETLSEEEWTANGLHPLKKILILNFDDYGFYYPQGIEIIDKNHLAVIENNNFGVVNGNPASHTFELNKSAIKLEIIELPFSLEMRQ